MDTAATTTRHYYTSLMHAPYNIALRNNDVITKRNIITSYIRHVLYTETNINVHV